MQVHEGSNTLGSLVGGKGCCQSRVGWGVAESTEPVSVSRVVDASNLGGAEAEAHCAATAWAFIETLASACSKEVSSAKQACRPA